MGRGGQWLGVGTRPSPCDSLTNLLGASGAPCRTCYLFLRSNFMLVMPPQEGTAGMWAPGTIPALLPVSWASRLRRWHQSKSRGEWQPEGRQGRPVRAGGCLQCSLRGLGAEASSGTCARALPAPGRTCLLLLNSAGGLFGAVCVGLLCPGGLRLPSAFSSAPARVSS